MTAECIQLRTPRTVVGGRPKLTSLRQLHRQPGPSHGDRNFRAGIRRASCRSRRLPCPIEPRFPRLRICHPIGLWEGRDGPRKTLGEAVRATQHSCTRSERSRSAPQQCSPKTGRSRTVRQPQPSGLNLEDSGATQPPAPTSSFHLEEVGNSTAVMRGIGMADDDDPTASAPSEASQNEAQEFETRRRRPSSRPALHILDRIEVR
jgi:hypothetical protein